MLEDQGHHWKETDLGDDSDVMKFLHKHRLTTTPKISLTVRESAIGNYQLLHPQSGIPNLLIRDLWKNEEYAETVI